MRADAVVIGAELDGLVAAARLCELGHSVCLIANGGSSLHYAPGGIRVLGRIREGPQGAVSEPNLAFALLDKRHPYALAGAARVKAAVAWYVGLLAQSGTRMSKANGANLLGVTPTGLPQPVLLAYEHQATFDRIAGKRVAVVDLKGQRDLPVDLLVKGLRDAGIDALEVSAEPPGPLSDNTGLARTFDRMSEPRSYFAGLCPLLPPDVGAVLMPAVLGLRRHAQVIEAAAAELGVPVLEVPTLPPSVPGMRLTAFWEAELLKWRCTIRRNVRTVGARSDGDHVRAVVDENGRSVEGTVYILANGGVLMGGLLVDSTGRVSEPLFGLDVVQTEPLRAASAPECMSALHACGVETDETFRPARKSVRCRNVFASGRTLAHWNASEELSAEGVSIVTGWTAAEYAALHLRG